MATSIHPAGIAVALGLSLMLLAGCAVRDGTGRYKQDPLVQHWQQRKAQLLAERRQVVGLLGEDHPAVADVDRQIRWVEALLADRLNELEQQRQARAYPHQSKAAESTQPSAD